jgi:hypothetical protein
MSAVPNTVVAKSLRVLDPLPYTYVRCVGNPMKEPLTIGQFYQVMPNHKIRKDKGEVGHTLGKFEMMPANYLDMFK